MARTNQAVVIPYKPRNWAKKLHAAMVRWIVLVLHRRAGKTTAAINHLQRDAMRYANTRYAYIAPTFKQAKRIVWGMAKIYARNIPGVKFNESELLISYPNGSEIMILGSDSPDSLRGIALWGCFLDEYPQQSPVVFTEIITKCLADHKGYCIFGGTPKGKGHFHKVYDVAGKNPNDWVLIYKTIDQSLDEETGEVIDNLRTALEDDRKLVEQGIMTEDEFQQEWYCSFEAAIKGAVFLKEIGKARKDGRIGLFTYDESLPVYTVWDLGIGDATSIGFYQRVGNKIYMIDYYENTGVGFAHYAKYVKDKPYVYGKHFAPHDIKKRELGSGKTLLYTAKKLGIEFEIVPSIGLKQGIDVTRAFWSKLHINAATCEIFLDLIGLYHYEFDDIHRVYSPKPVHDFSSHAADQLRYAAIIEEEMYVDDEAALKTPDAPQPDDEYRGQDGDFDGMLPSGMGKHPVLKGVDIGRMGHTKK
jgi:phage terminase large subunit